MSRLGEYLKSKREEMGVSLDQIAETTKILRRYLAQIESGDYQYLPSRAYIKGYVISYARYLGLDQKEVLKLFNKEFEEEEPAGLIERYSRRRAERPFYESRKLLVAVFAAAFILISLAGHHLIGQSEKRIAIKPVTKGKVASKKVVPAKLPQPSSLDIVARNVEAVGITAENKKPVEKKPSPIKKVAALESLGKVPGTIKPVPITRTPASETRPVAENRSSEGKATAGMATSPAVQPEEKEEAPATPRLEVIKIVTCKGVKNREPFGISSVFPLGTYRVYCWMKVKCDKPPTVLRHIYYFEGRKICEVPLAIKYPTMRTWSYKTVAYQKKAGKWRVDVCTEDGYVIGSIQFEVQ